MRLLLKSCSFNSRWRSLDTMFVFPFARYYCILTCLISNCYKCQCIFSIFVGASSPGSILLYKLSSCQKRSQLSSYQKHEICRFSLNLLQLLFKARKWRAVRFLSEFRSMSSRVFKLLLSSIELEEDSSYFVSFFPSPLIVTDLTILIGSVYKPSPVAVPGPVEMSLYDQVSIVLIYAVTSLPVIPHGFGSLSYNQARILDNINTCDLT